MFHAGIDLGGTKIEIRVLDACGQQVHIARTDTPRHSYINTIEAIVKLIQQADTKLQKECTVGIGIPGAVDPVTGKIKNANSTWLIGESLHTDLEARLSRSVHIANDADCMTLSEAVDGSAASSTSVFGVIIGTGVGGGLCINKQLLSGPNAICGEWGHNPLPWQNNNDTLIDCFCGKQGCIETFVSGPGLCKHYEELSGEPITRVESIIEKASAENALAAKTMDDFHERLAKGLASVINILDPEAIVLAGGLSNIEAIYQEVPIRWGKYVLSNSVETKLLKAKFGDSSGARGAAWLGKQRLS